MWIALDYGDIVVHLFEPEKRSYYALEELWGTGKIVPFTLEENTKHNEKQSEETL
jgi:ribosome-associated protein